MQLHGSKYFACRHPRSWGWVPTLRMGSLGQNATVSEHGHVTCKIKENHECINMVANILPADTPTLGDGTIG